LLNLVAITAAAISTITTAAATLAAITAASAAATTATAAVTTTAAAATTAAFTGLHGARFVDSQGATVDLLSVKLGDGCLGLFGRAHLDKSEAAGASGHAIVDHLNPRDIARLGKEIGQVVFRHAKGQIAHVQFYTHFSFAWLADVSGTDLRCH
jgi:hypothetical protein